MKACTRACLLFSVLAVTPLSAGELRTFELPSERLAPYLTRPAAPAAVDVRQQENAVQPSPQEPPPESRAWRQEMQTQDAELQILLEQLR